MSDDTKRALRWGLLSTGRIGDRIVEAVRQSERSVVQAVGSRDAARARVFASERDIPDSYGSYEALIERDDVDVVYVALPNALHHEWVINAVRAGKHVLCEKPLALKATHVAEMSLAADRNGVVLQEASMMRFHPQTSAIRKVIEQGGIGEVRACLAHFSFTLQRGGDVRWSSALGGGSLWDLGCYPVTLFQYALGMSPTEVMGWSAEAGEGVDRTFAAMLRYSDETVAHFVTSFAALPGWGAEFIGTAGRIRMSHPFLNRTNVDTEVAVTRNLSRKARGTFGDAVEHLETEVMRFPEVNAYVDEIVAMERMVLDGQPIVFPLAEVQANVATLEGLHESAKMRQPLVMKEQWRAAHIG